jgi:hypothetical protein
VITALPCGAWALGKGESMLAIGVGNAQGDFVNPLRSSPYLSTDSGDPDAQIVVQGEFWKMLSDDYAVNVAVNYGFNSMTAKPSSNAPPGSPDLEFSSSSLAVRVGGDRVGHVGDRFDVFIGPGIEYWNGKTKFTNVYGTTPPDDEVESESVTRYSLCGRVGGIMKLSGGVGLVGHVGHNLGYASSEESGAKLAWWTGGFSAFWGLVFTFGGSAP